jgi:hypothetical protein
MEELVDTNDWEADRKVWAANVSALHLTGLMA